MNHLSLFSGIGGFDLAAEWIGWNNIAHCEINPFCRQVLKYYWPKAISYEDIKSTDFTIHRGTVDIVTGGFPCQPYSLAGKRKGKEDERHLWPEMLRAIREIKPRWICGENVFGLINWNGGMVFDEVCAALETEGYYNYVDKEGKERVAPVIIPAAGVNAPHQRYRVWFIAHSKRDFDCGTKRGIYDKEEGMAPIFGQKHCTSWQPSGTNKLNDEGDESIEHVVTDTACGFCEQQRFEKKSNHCGRKVCKHEQEGTKIWNRPDTDGKAWNVTNTGRAGFEELNTPGVAATPGHDSRFPFNDWSHWPTVPPICDGDDGLPSRLDGITFSKWRNESIKSGGNAVVPQVVYQIFKAIEAFEHC